MVRKIFVEKVDSSEEGFAIMKVKKTSRKKILAAISVAILVALMIGLAVGYVTGSFPVSGYERRNTALQNQIQLLRKQLDFLNTNLRNLQDEQDDSQKIYDTINTIYPYLEVEYDGGLKVPYTTIREGDVVWAFKATDGTIKQWYTPLETYTYYANRAKPTEYRYLGTDGQTFKARNVELFVQPKLFSNVIHDLTDGKTDRDFVQEVFNLRNQLTTYGNDTIDTPQWSAETITKGTGDCEDFAILMGNLLTSGNQYANYNMTVQMVYMDTNNPTSPQTINHVSLQVKYEDGITQLVDSTSISVLNPWPKVGGWFYDI